MKINESLLLIALAFILLLIFFVLSYQKKSTYMISSDKPDINPQLSSTLFSQMESFDQPITGDGNCFYRSIARFIYHRQDEHRRVRWDLAKFFSTLNDEDKNKYYNPKNVSPDDKVKKLLGQLKGDDHWGGNDECTLVSLTYDRPLVIRNIIPNTESKSFNVYIEGNEWVLYFPVINPSYEDFMKELRPHLCKSNIIHKKDFIFLSFNSSRNGENIIGHHFETFLLS